MNDALIISKKDIEEGKKLNSIFMNLSPEGRLQAQAYLSALRDKESMKAAEEEEVV